MTEPVTLEEIQALRAGEDRMFPDFIYDEMERQVKAREQAATALQRLAERDPRCTCPP